MRCIFGVFPGHFYCMRGPLLVELMGHDNSAGAIMLHNMHKHMYTAEFVVHSM